MLVSAHNCGTAAAPVNAVLDAHGVTPFVLPADRIQRHRTNEPSSFIGLLRADPGSRKGDKNSTATTNSSHVLFAFRDL
jgi:hypothetical protein